MTEDPLVAISNGFLQEELLAKPYANTWTAAKEIFLCTQVLKLMPEILNKAKTPLWKKVLHEFNVYFNSSGYKIKQSRTMRDKFIRMYNKFLKTNKPVERMSQLETVLHHIRMVEMGKVKKDRALKSNNRASLEGDLEEEEDDDDDDEINEDDDDDDDDDEIEPNHQMYRGMQQPRLQLSVQQRVLSLERNSPQQQLTSHSPPQQLNSNTTGLATIQFKFPPEVDQLNYKLGNIEKDVAQLKRDVSLIKSQLASILNALKRP